ncbi:MAG: glucuronate isomerase [Candidatus Azobacteroides pseudotrichonymphae]|nr:MAG: glucuronate isomerase [Candidatus Azobacteroides pseudotrichonymphae]
MKTFMDDNFILQTEIARQLYHENAKSLPIIDYHCHLSPEMIADDRQFDNLGQIWLEGDHYKWRAMRTNGIDERYITGESTSDFEKFEKWAETVPYTMRNPLYHWTHLELKTVFGINKLLNPESALEIYEHCTDLLRTPAFSTRNLMERYNVEVICTTDDPIDSLEHHIKLKNEGFKIKVLPTWRPDKTMEVENPSDYRKYVEKLSTVSGIAINCFEHLLEALKVRHDFFDSVGCKLSDHGLEMFYAEDYTLSSINTIFNKVYDKGNKLNNDEIVRFKSCMLIELAKMDWEKNWAQQFHYGALRNNNTKMFMQIGADSGYDSIGDWNTARSMSKFLNCLDKQNKLTRTILYNLNPNDNEMIATMVGNFQDGSIAGKIQFGAGWWFLDQKMGMEAQMNSLSVLGLLSHFVGMLTDSRSFLSYTRHEYFRRILCNLVGNDVEQGLLPVSELSFLSQLVENISYYNAKKYFGF